MEIYERLSGARLHANYVRPGGVAWVSHHFILYIDNSLGHAIGLYGRYLRLGSQISGTYRRTGGYADG